MAASVCHQTCHRKVQCYVIDSFVHGPHEHSSDSTDYLKRTLAWQPDIDSKNDAIIESLFLMKYKIRERRRKRKIKEFSL
jgi:hypothetical protein